jgi:hypothetical protein
MSNKKPTSTNQVVLSAFIGQLDECVADIRATYPTLMETDERFVQCTAYFEMIKKTNPRIMIVAWKMKVNKTYKTQILAGDVNFFLEKDYQADAEELYNDTVDRSINDLRETIREMSAENIATCMKYIQNLCKLADMYDC